MSVETTSGPWIQQVERQAARIRAQIASMTDYVLKCSGTAADVERVCDSYYLSLSELYQKDFPLARAIETSDLLLRLEGRPIQDKTPKLSLIASVFTNVRRRVGGVAYAISGLVNEAQQYKEVDLELAAYATGSLFLGFNLPDPNSDDNLATLLLGENDPLYIATKKAINTIGIISQKIASGAEFVEMEREISDPLVRDIALSAVQGLAPSVQSKIDSVMLIGKDLPTKEFAKLTKETRKNVRGWMKKPIQSHDKEQVIGVIREIDLDLHRFALRRISGMELQEVRCIYSAKFASQAKALVDKSVIVSGSVQRDHFGNPRLLQVESMVPVEDVGSKQQTML